MVLTLAAIAVFPTRYPILKALTILLGAPALRTIAANSFLHISDVRSAFLVVTTFAHAVLVAGLAPFVALTVFGLAVGFNTPTLDSPVRGTLFQEIEDTAVF